MSLSTCLGLTRALKISSGLTKKKYAPFGVRSSARIQRTYKTRCGSKNYLLYQRRLRSIKNPKIKPHQRAEFDALLKSSLQSSYCFVMYDCIHTHLYTIHIGKCKSPPFLFFKLFDHFHDKVV